MSLKENFTIGVLESGFKQGLLLIACASYLACSHSPSPTSFLSFFCFNVGKFQSPAILKRFSASKFYP